jgi:hypothetical protein
MLVQAKALQRTAWLLALALSGCISVAWGAQSDSESNSETTVPVPAEVPRVYAEGHIWVGAGLGAPVRSLSADLKGNLLALGADGSIYRKVVGGVWRVVLSPTTARLSDPLDVDEEALLLEAEGFLLEEGSFGDDDDTEESGDDLEDAEIDDEEVERAPMPDEAPHGADDVSEMIMMDSRGDGSDGGPVAGWRVWCSERVAGLALAYRDDGLWRSIDGGQTWRSAGQLPPVFSFVDAPGGGLLAGTVEGLRGSDDGGLSWTRSPDPISSIKTFALVSEGTTVFAGTQEGLYRSVDGRIWAKLLSRYDADVPVWAIGIDRYWEGGLWVAGPVGVLRSDDGGQQLRAAGQNTMPGTVSLLPLERPGHILAAGMDGVWESQDGGMRWRPVVNGLPSPANTQLAVDTQGPVLAGLDGIFYLAAAAADAALAPPEAIKVPPGADMGALVVVALNRPGMAMSTLLGKASIARALLLPKLTISSDWSRARMLSADHVARSNRGHLRTSWRLGMTACFGACTTASSYHSYSSDIGDASGAGDVVVVGDEVYSASAEGSLAPMAANVAERVTRYRTDVANRITELVIARHRLLESSGGFRGLPLREQIGHELDIAESNARLDVYTNGYFTRVLEGS